MHAPGRASFAQTVRSCQTPQQPLARAAPARRFSPALRRPGSAAPATGFAGRSAAPAEFGPPVRTRARWWRFPPRGARRARHARLQAAQELILFQCIQPDQHSDAVTEQNGHAILIDPKGQRRRCQDIAALEARRIQSIGDEEGAGRSTGSAQRRPGSLADGFFEPAVPYPFRIQICTAFDPYHDPQKRAPVFRKDHAQTKG